MPEFNETREQTIMGFSCCFFFVLFFLGGGGGVFCLFVFLLTVLSLHILHYARER